MTLQQAVAEALKIAPFSFNNPQYELGKNNFGTFVGFESEGNDDKVIGVTVSISRKDGLDGAGSYQLEAPMDVPDFVQYQEAYVDKAKLDAILNAYPEIRYGIKPTPQEAPKVVTPIATHKAPVSWKDTVIHKIQLVQTNGTVVESTKHLGKRLGDCSEQTIVWLACQWNPPKQADGKISPLDEKLKKAAHEGALEIVPDHAS